MVKTAAPAPTSRAGTSRSRRSWRGPMWVLLRVNLPAVFTARGFAAVFGLALGGICLLAVLILHHSIGQPFEALDKRIHEVAPKAHILRSRIGNWMPETTFRDVESVLGSRDGAAVPMSGGFAELTGPDAQVGALVLGGDCRIERLIGDIDCADRLASLSAERDEVGVPAVALTSRIAAALGASEGDRIAFPGGQEAVVGYVSDDSRSDSVNGGFVVIGEIAAVAELFGHPGQIAAIYLADPTVDDQQAVQASLGDRVDVTQPNGQTRYLVPMIQQVRQFLLIGGLAAGMTGVFLAGSTLVLSAVHRRRTMALLQAVGATSRTLVPGFMAEGAMCGLLAAAVAVPGGILVGRLLVDGYGSSLLRGSGVRVGHNVPLEFVVVTVAALVVLGITASLPALVAIMRQKSSEVVSAASRPEASRMPSAAWAIPALLGWVVSLTIMWLAGRAFVPSLGLQAGTALYSVSTMALTVLLASRVAKRLPPFPRHLQWARVLVRSNLERAPLRTGFTVTMVALGISLTFGITTATTSFNDGAISPEARAELSNGRFLVVGRTVGEPSAPPLSPEYLEGLEEMPEVAEVAPMANLMIDGTLSVQSMPLDSLGPKFVSGTGLDTETLRTALRRGEIVLNPLAANARGIGAGDEIEVPTAEGTSRLKVAAVGSSALADENGLGQVLFLDLESAARLWNAAPSSAIVFTEDGVDVAALAERLPTPGRIRVYEPAAFIRDAQEFSGRVMTPFRMVGQMALVIALVGVANMLLLGLLSRREERASLRAMGMSERQEYIAVLADALVLAGLGALFGIVGGLVFAWGIVLAVPLILGVEPSLTVDPLLMLRSLALAMAVCTLGALLPVIQLRRMGVPAVTSE